MLPKAVCEQRHYFPNAVCEQKDYMYSELPTAVADTGFLTLCACAKVTAVTCLSVSLCVRVCVRVNFSSLLKMDIK